MPESREVCCCGVYSWTKVIAWLHIVLSAFVIIVVGIVLILVIGGGPAKYEEIIETSNDPNLAPIKGYGFGSLVALLVAVTALFLVSLFMGIILVKGANERNACYIKAWLIYMIICVFFDLITIFATMSMATIVPDIIGMLLYLAIVIFVIWVVWEFKKEIDMDRMGGTGVIYKA